MVDEQPPPILIGCSHGTRLPAGRRAMALLRLAIGAARPGLEVRAANVDVQKPALDDVVRALSEAGRAVVVVPLLLSTGYHVKVDIARAVSSAHGLAVAAAALGPDPLLVRVLQQRLTEAGAGPHDPVVLAAAGSSDPQANEDVEASAAALSLLRAAPVTVGYLASASPTVADAVTQARSDQARSDQARSDHLGRPVAIASYLLAPGHFATRLLTAGADHVAAPLAPHPALATLALARYDQALTTLTQP